MVSNEQLREACPLAVHLPEKLQCKLLDIEHTTDGPIVSVPCFTALYGCLVLTRSKAVASTRVSSPWMVPLGDGQSPWTRIVEEECAVIDQLESI